MGHTNNTPNYNLPIFQPTDKPAWMTDFNAAMTAIDTGINGTKVVANAAQIAAENAVDMVTGLEPNVTDNTQRIQALENAGGIVPVRIPYETASGFREVKGSVTKVGPVAYVAFSGDQVPGAGIMDGGNKNRTILTCEAFGYDFNTAISNLPLGVALLSSAEKSKSMMLPVTANITSSSGEFKLKLRVENINNDAQTVFSDATDLVWKFCVTIPIVHSVQ